MTLDTTRALYLGGEEYEYLPGTIVCTGTVPGTTYEGGDDTLRFVFLIPISIIINNN